MCLLCCLLCAGQEEEAVVEVVEVLQFAPSLCQHCLPVVAGPGVSFPGPGDNVLCWMWRSSRLEDVL